ncbi:BgTH12-03494 [Blumeria graminis f. sp. triticale]|uniref:BgtA-21340 n=3 Tax=Blumeria graminis TaxID=34373 RepID=A0A9X9L8T2_BLUGR|nr:hypothetical protein BGT96224_A21340 [Blumeria graminis f. sp. tritici 96224]CAD6499378.1 BgTH12-03494 [Blumeria graminis f. sp. triticale]VCU39524.1 BgtA-21340 [Blumeria graminis f. sp. tritici]
MSGTDYSYDDECQFFPFFFLTMAGIITIPLTYSLLKPSTNPRAIAPKITSEFRPDQADIIDSLLKAQKRRELKLKRICTVVIGWFTMFAMTYLIMVTARSVTKIWNPYDILGISESASAKEIKSHFKRMSLKFHPDKIRPDPAKNQTAQSLSDHFVELTKAYKALTNEEIRNNYIQFGHPDGKQSFSIGIALPNILITDGNGKYVLLVYALLLGVLLPYLVGSWWYGTQSMSKEDVLVKSANNLFLEYKDDITQSGILSALTTGVEFQKMLSGQSKESDIKKIEAKILETSSPDLLDNSPCGMCQKDQENLQSLENSVRRESLGLLWAYLGRIDLNDVSLDRLKLEAAPIALALNRSFSAIAFAFGSTAPVLQSYFTSQNLLQAVPPGGSPLLQLPYFTSKIAGIIEGNSKNHLTIQEYMKIPGSIRRKQSIGKGLLTEAQYKIAVSVARQLPRLQVEKAFFKVPGEKFITTNSLISLVLKGRFIPPGTSHIPKVEDCDLEDVDPEEGDVDAILGRNKTGAGGRSSKKQKPFQPPLAHSPYFARDYSPRWHVFLADSKQGKIAVPPFTFTAFEKPIFDQQGKPTFNVQTVKAQFQAPPQAGHYTFVMHLVCDSYIGFDTKMEITLVVEEASKAVEIKIEDDISEPDEDSIAGQMQALKTGGTGTASKKKSAAKDSSDDESDTDGDVNEAENGASETDTDTDGE